MSDEPDIRINGQYLTIGQAMTVRVALGTFAVSLIDDGLGDDVHGIAMAKAYKARLHEILIIIERAPHHPEDKV